MCDNFPAGEGDNDIKANGLIHPGVVDKDGVLIDGRNRAGACEIVGI
jgi:ParB-like chromosome segregation protein Spo0J